VVAAVVTGETRLADVAGLHLLELADVALRVIVDVGLTWPMAALAPQRRGRGTRVLPMTVLRALEGFTLRGVTGHAGVGSCITRERGGR